MRIWNLTPHAVNYADGAARRTIGSDAVLRLDQTDEPGEPVDGMTTVHTRYGRVQGLPAEVASGDVLIVSTLVGDKWPADERPPGVTVLIPDTGATCKRDEQGRIVSVCRFIRK